MEPGDFLAALSKADAPPSEVIVIDGESLRDDLERELVMRTARARAEGDPTILYIYVRIPGDHEVEIALRFADDVIFQGWDFPVRLQRRVQTVTLAPWRRAMATRIRAMKMGNRRLKVLGSGQ